MDPSERYNITDKNADVVGKIETVVLKHLSTVIPVKSNLENVVTTK